MVHKLIFKRLVYNYIRTLYLWSWSSHTVLSTCMCWRFFLTLFNFVTYFSVAFQFSAGIWLIPQLHFLITFVGTFLWDDNQAFVPAYPPGKCWGDRKSLYHSDIRYTSNQKSTDRFVNLTEYDYEISILRFGNVCEDPSRDDNESVVPECTHVPTG